MDTLSAQFSKFKSHFYPVLITWFDVISTVSHFGSQECFLLILAGSCFSDIVGAEFAVVNHRAEAMSGREDTTQLRPRE